MFSKHVVFAVVVAAGVLAACANRATSVMPSGEQVALPAFEGMAMTATLPKNTVGENFPADLGTYKSPFWRATIGGFSQTKYSQTLGFPPETKITLRNLNSTTPHTLNVIKAIKGPPAMFPQNPSLPTSPNGHGILGTGYRSGIIQPGKSVTIELSKAGTYMIGCAFHYASNGMRDIFVVKDGAKPGQEATPPPQATSSPSTGPSPTGYGG